MTPDNRTPWDFLASRKARNLLSNAASTGKVESSDGETRKLEAGLAEAECRFIHRMIRKNPIRHTLEVGCAHGVSTVTICDAIQNRQGSFHRAIDIEQSGHWRGIGAANVNRCGFRNFELLEEDSAHCLPRLAHKGETLDFALIDGWHSFDHALMDFFYINRMLKTGGILVFDDAANLSINKVIRYVEKYPCYEIIGHVPRRPWSRRRKIAHTGRLIAHSISRVLPRAVSENLMDAVVTDYNPQRENATLVAFRKTGEDKRDFWWCPHF